MVLKLAGAGAAIVLTAGGITFANEWYQTHSLDWKVPVATLVLAAAVDLISDLDSGAAVILGILILAGALTTKYNGKNPVDTISQLAGKKP
jgi:hypothetical protein